MPDNEPTKARVHVTRVFDAPRDLVFKMWTDPKHLAAWWGPRGFTNPVCETDPRAGGSLKIVMRGPNGIDYPMTGTFREVVPPDRLIFVARAIDETGQAHLESTTTVTFADHGKDGRQTRLTLTAQAVALSPLGPKMLAGMEAGWTQSLEKLAHAVFDTSDREIVSTRIFDAPRDLVWEAWTNPKHLVNWWGPKGFRNTFHTFNFRVGGAWKFTMHGPDGTDYPNEIIFVEIIRPERIVLDHQFGPAFRATADFDDLGDKTRVTFRGLFQSTDDYNMVKGYAIPGNVQTFDRLEAELAKMR
jgi:uncharacterized protein YndB with AHSA1/START domain